MLYLYSKLQTMWATRERGASAVEYGLLIAGIAAVIVVIVFAFGTQISGVFGKTCHAVTNNGAAGTTCP
jgi:pilus assembly protein Flp/PilA